MESHHVNDMLITLMSLCRDNNELRPLFDSGQRCQEALPDQNAQ